MLDHNKKRFLDFVKNDETYRECYDGMFILFKTGLRVSELSGLTLRDIDMKERTININHQLQTTGHKGKYIEETKTNAGTRILPMTEEVSEGACEPEIPKGGADHRRIQWIFVSGQTGKGNGIVSVGKAFPACS